MSKKKICFIAQFPPPMHGLSKAVETLYNSRLSEDFEFEKVDIKNNKAFLKSLVSIYKSQADLFYFTISQSVGGNLRDLLILKLLLLQHKKCLIHLHGGYYRQLVDNDLPVWQRKANYKAVSSLSGGIVLGKSLKSIFEGMLPEDRIFVVPNCVDDEYLMSDDEFEEKISTLCQRTIKHVLYLSNFIRSKGYREVLKMASLEKERCDRGKVRKLHFDFAGKFFEKAEERFFFNYIREYQLDEYVTYHGVVGGDEKRVLLKNCDIFVLLTRYPNEGQPISILEAMGNGMMIVTTNHAGIPDIVKDGINGIIVTQGVPEIQNSMDEIQKYEIENRSIIKELYTEEKYISLMTEVFDSVFWGATNEDKNF